MNVTILGTGTSCGVPQIGCQCEVCTSDDPHDKRLRCSALIETEGKRILIDCGPEFRQQMLSIDFKPLDAIFITHEHYDHVGGIDDLRPYSVFGEVNLYAEPYCAQHLRERLPYCFIPKEKRYPGVPALNMYEIEPHNPVMVGENPAVEVMPIRVMHGRLPILGFRIGRLAYITDMKTIPEEEFEYLKDIDTLIVNGLRHYPHPTHQTIEEAAAFSETLGVRETYLIHMSHHILRHEVEEKNMPPHVHLAYDGMKLTVK